MTSRMNRTNDPRWNALVDELGPIVDGDDAAVGRHADLLSSDDDARDLRHDAREVAAEVRDAGADHQLDPSFTARLLEAVDAGRVPSFASAPTVPDHARTQPQIVAPPAPVFPFAPQAPANDLPAAYRSAPDQNLPVAQHTPPTPTPVSHAANTSPAKPRRRWGVLAAVATLIVGGLGVAFVSLGGLASHNAWHLPPLPANDANDAAEGFFVVGSIARAGDSTTTGIEARLPGAAQFAPVANGARLSRASSLRTDSSTRARVDLADGTHLTLNHGTEISIDPVSGRLLLESGEVVADVVHRGSRPPIVVETKTGRVVVLGTKLSVSAAAEQASIRVIRGHVRIESTGGEAAEVRAGEEGVLARDVAPSVTPSIGIAQTMAWSALSEPEAGSLSGFGELRARRPGEDPERARPLHLANHRVTIRIAGNVARTDVEEVFGNDTSNTLEGTYRFPMPSDSAISRLALDVEGRMEEGAFVERTRAARIWRGVIRNATPMAQRERNEEFIWVPGPWRDPAILEWQRGGQFQLRIFPIPASGSRRVAIGYTQTVAPYGNVRRYVYPLPHGQNAAMRAAEFVVDARVVGARPGSVRVVGYDAQTRTDGDATAIGMTATQFAPRGDLVIEYALANDAELTAWTYSGNAVAPVPATDRETEEGVRAAHVALANDARGYAAFAIRPSLPRWASTIERDFVVVVDSSQSMTGERYTRATSLASTLIGELDRANHRVAVLACDVQCREMGAPDPSAMGPQRERAANFVAPSYDVARQASAFLSAIRPGGASNLVGNLTRAARLANAARPTTVLYIGDGMATLGHRRPVVVTEVVRGLTRESAGGSVTFSTIGIGTDADARTLASVARAGGGVYQPFVPGETTAASALALLESTYGSSLENPTLELPQGLADVAPSELPTIRAGGEVVVTARMSGDVHGDVVLRGKIGGQPFERRYPVNLVPSTAAANAFVPRLWAAKTIEQIETDTSETARPIALSKAYHVMSRGTSLLVLESEAMFRAFGVDRATTTSAEWTGTEVADGHQMNAEPAEGDNASTDLPSDDAVGLGQGILGAVAGDLSRRDPSTVFDRGGGAMPARTRAANAGGGSAEGFASNQLDTTAEREADLSQSEVAEQRRMTTGRSAGARPNMEAPAPQPQAASEAVAAPRRHEASSSPASVATPVTPPPPPPRGPGSWMRQVWFRVGSVTPDAPVSAGTSRNVAAAEAALAAEPESRDRTRALLRALSRTDDTARSLELAIKWMSKDPMDREAITFFADALARNGERAESLRILSGIVEVGGDESSAHERLASAHDRAGNAELACAHRLARAEVARTAETMADAVRCTRQLAGSRGSFVTPAADGARVLDITNDGTVRSRALALAAQPGATQSLRGDITLSASFGAGSPGADGASDIDLALVAPDGTRISFMGGRRDVFANAVYEPTYETLGIRTPRVGTYLIEVVAPAGTEGTHRGTVNATVLGQRRSIPFAFSGTRTTIGRIEIRRESRLEPVRLIGGPGRR